MIKRTMRFLMLLSLFVFLVVLLKMKFKSGLQSSIFILQFLSLITGYGNTYKVNAIIIQTGKIVPPPRLDNFQMEQVAAKRWYEVEIKISSKISINLPIRTSSTRFCCE